MAEGKKFFFFLKGQIRQDETVDSDFPAGADKSFCAVGKDNIGVGHEDQRNRHIAAQFPYKLKDIVCRYASLERPQIGALDNRSFSGRIGKRDPQFNEIGSIFYGSPYRRGGSFQIRIATGNKRNKRFTVFKCCFDITHEDPPLCILRWPRSPCLPGRIW